VILYATRSPERVVFCSVSSQAWSKEKQYMRPELEEKLLDMMLQDLEGKDPALSSILSQMFDAEATQQTIFIQLFIALKMGKHKPIRLGEYFRTVRGENDDPLYKGLCDAFVAFSEKHITAKPIRRSSTGGFPVLVDDFLNTFVIYEVIKRIESVFKEEDDLNEIRQEAADLGLKFPDEYVKHFIQNKLNGQS
jgi:hypothetical protein